MIHTIHINSSLLSGAYQVHLYVEYKYLPFKYIQCRLGLGPKHVLPFAVQIEFHFTPEKAPGPSLKKSLCLMYLPLDGNICFFISMETEKQTEREEKLKTVGDEGRKQVVLGDHSAVASCLSPGSHLSEQTPPLCRADMGFVEGRLGKTHGFCPSCGLVCSWSTMFELTKNNFTPFTLHLPLCSSKHRLNRAKHHVKLLCRDHTTLIRK